MVDLAVQLYRYGYEALPRLWGTHVGDPSYAATRLLGHRAHVVRGEAGARMFYDESVIRREGAVPAPLRLLLFGPGAVHGLDDEAHRRRKAIFLDLLAAEPLEALGDDVARELADTVRSWPGRTPLSLFDELVRVYGGCVLPWAGVRVEPGEAATVARRLAWIVDGFGFDPGAGPRAAWARWWADRWARRIIREARVGDRSTRPGSMLEALATGSGAALPIEVAAVELINVLRPTVAVAWLAAFAALALVPHPERGVVLAGPAARAERRHFADEVRRTAPFVPALAGRVRASTTWEGHALSAGDVVVLDVPATNRRSWPDPSRFRPERFAERTPGPFEHVPQGGGDPSTGHRCPGEQVAMTLLDRTLLQLARIGFTVSTGEPDLRRVPALPSGGVGLTGVEVPAGSLVG